MVNVIKLRKGLDIRLKGAAAHKDVPTRRGSDFALCPADYQGVTPKVVVKEGDRVLAGDALFVNKQFPDIRFASPVSGVVTGVVRGERRKVLAVTVKADDAVEYRDFGRHDISGMTGEDVVSSLLAAGLFGLINQLPYAVSTNNVVQPKAIFVSAFRDMPLAADFLYELSGNEEAFQAGISALSKIQNVYVGINPDGENVLGQLKDATVTVFKGKCPAGNVGVQVNHIAPVNKGDVVWTVSPTAVIFFGRLLLTGKVDMRHKVALAGQQVKDPAYSEVIVGQKLETLVEGRINLEGTRLINGNPLTGVKATKDDYIGPQVSEVTAIPEGDHADEMLGWILPRTNQFSASRSYFSWLMPKTRAYDCDARIKGGERHMIMSGEYDKVLPMDIYGEYLIKAIITGDIDRQEALGIYEVSPEDFAVAEFVDSSKLQLQRIVREGLDILRKENA
ncbi:MAG: Na(+)-translocating NADH-quinone reductase subunit A [Prevotella sp.]